MVSPVFKPQPPVPATWAPAGGWYAAGQASVAQPAATGAAPGSAEDLAARDAYIRSLVQALNNANDEGYTLERDKLRMQLEDAQKGRDNALRIAQLSAETSRYGTDVGRQNLLDQLQQSQRQFDANHDLDLKRFGLEQQRFGLDVGKAFTEYGRTYDDLFALQDIKANVASIGAGRGPVALGQSGTPHAKTWEDWSALTGLAMPGQPMMTGPRATASGTASPQSYGYGATQTAGQGTDPRLSAASAVMKALPPSDGVGHDGQDWNAINAITSLYFGKKPGQVEALGQERQRAAAGALARAGYNPALVMEERDRSLPRQGSVRAA